MRNLKILTAQALAFPEELQPCATAWDATSDSVICAFGPTEGSPTITVKRGLCENAVSGPDFEVVASWNAPCPSPDLTCDKILCLQYFSDAATTCLILAGGDLLVVREEGQNDQEKIEVVGSVDAGIASAAWAPDEELLAVVTNSDALLLMTRSFEPITEMTLTLEDLNASKHVSVGWGKKETQFQGKRAKALRDPTMPELIESGKLSPYDDGRTTVSWRGDGAFLAVNRVVPNGRRVIRIFTRDGTIDGVSEPVDGLESALSWRPAGNLIAGIQRLESQLHVIFFERNGLRHGGFALRLSTDDMKTWAAEVSLGWNTDSTVLTVSFRDRIQLWTVSNYHYYLKREILFDNGAPSLSQLVSWHPEKPLRMAAIAQGILFVVEYAFVVDRGSTIQPHDNGIVAIVDGCSLKLTPLKNAMIPPPMSFVEIAASKKIVDCAISRGGNRVAVLTNIGIEVFEWDFRSKPAQMPNRVASLVFTAETGSPSVASFRQILMQKNDIIGLLLPSGAGGLKMITYSIEDSSTSLTETQVDALESKGNKQSLFSRFYTNTTYDHLWLEDWTGLRCLDQPKLSFSSAVHCSTEIALIHKEHPNEDHDFTLNGDDQLPPYAHVFSMSRNGKLFADDRLIVKGCTSFVTTGLHLIFTTSQNLLKFVHLDASGEFKVPGDTAVADERCRSIERGAKIITVIPSIYAVVLQMPRGNLETVYPRALVLAGIRQHIDEQDFKSAFLACQNHQVDVNIIYDHRPDLFIQHIPRFIEQVKSPSQIDLFLSKLSEDDVSKTLYRDTLTGSTASPAQNQMNFRLSGNMNGVSKHVPAGGKVNSICNAFLSILTTRRFEHMQNIVTAHVCKRPPDLVSALKVIASIRETNSVKAVETVSHLCFLSDVNRLYDTALSLYDLPLTLLVAQQAQRDPREYMPFLQSLNESSQLRRQFTIDDNLRNHDKALASLDADVSHEEAEAYTIKHALYPQALRLYRHDAGRLARYTRLHASYLTLQSNHLASAIASESVCDYTVAFTSYAKCSPPRWREALHCATMANPGIPAPELRSLAAQLANTLSEVERDYRSASQIQIDYLDDIPTAARLLCKASYFAEALRRLSSHHLTDLIPDIIDTSLAQKSGEITELIADCRLQLGAQVPRIQELRLKKAEDALAFFGGDAAASAAVTSGAAPDGQDIPDNVSLAPTNNASTLGGQSLFTRYGNRSNASTRFGGGTDTNSATQSPRASKTRRKEEKKRARGKKGSVYEEEYLVGSVTRLIERVNAVHGEVNRLLQGLARRGGVVGIERRELVEQAMTDLVGECERAVLEVWGRRGESRENAEPSQRLDHDHELDHEPEQEQEQEPRDPKRNLEHGRDGTLSRNGAVPITRPKGGQGVFWQSQIEPYLATATAVAAAHAHGGGGGGGADSRNVEIPTVKPWSSNT